MEYTAQLEQALFDAAVRADRNSDYVARLQKIETASMAVLDSWSNKPPPQRWNWDENLAALRNALEGNE